MALLHHVGLILEIVGFTIIAVFVGIFLTFKSELGIGSFLDRTKDVAMGLGDRFPFLSWLKKHNAVTLILAGLGSLIYLLGLVFKAVSTW